MLTPNSIQSPAAHEPPSHAEMLEADAALAGEAAAGGLRALEIALVVFVGLLVCPPLAIVAFLVFAPLFVLALVLGLLAAVISAPYLLVRHVRGHERVHLSVLRRRVRHGR